MKVNLLERVVGALVISGVLLMGMSVPARAQENQEKQQKQPRTVEQQQPQRQQQTPAAPQQANKQQRSPQAQAEPSSSRSVSNRLTLPRSRL